jgi:hypothetical protein
MHNALWLAGLKGANGGAVPEPPRGPAAVTRIPLTLGPPSMQAAGGMKAGVNALKAAMQLAGLSA